MKKHQAESIQIEGEILHIPTLPPEDFSVGDTIMGYQITEMTDDEIVVAVHHHPVDAPGELRFPRAMFDKEQRRQMLISGGWSPL